MDSAYRWTPRNDGLRVSSCRRAVVLPSHVRVAVARSHCRRTLALPWHTRVAVALSRCRRTTEITVRRLMFPKKRSPLRTAPTHDITGCGSTRRGDKFLGNISGRTSTSVQTESKTETGPDRSISGPDRPKSRGTQDRDRPGPTHLKTGPTEDRSTDLGRSRSANS